MMIALRHPRLRSAVELSAHPHRPHPRRPRSSSTPTSALLCFFRSRGLICQYLIILITEKGQLCSRIILDIHCSPALTVDCCYRLPQPSCDISSTTAFRLASVLQHAPVVTNLVQYKVSIT